MKKIKYIGCLLIFVAGITLMFTSCKKDETELKSHYECCVYYKYPEQYGHYDDDTTFYNKQDMIDFMTENTISNVNCTSSVECYEVLTIGN